LRRKVARGVSEARLTGNGRPGPSTTELADGRPVSAKVDTGAGDVDGGVAALEVVGYLAIFLAAVLDEVVMS
jgi:hypothetical protein